MTAARAAGEIRVLLVDDDTEVRNALARTLTPERGLRVVGSLATADELVTAAVLQQPDVVLLDLDMPGRDALEAVEDLRYRGHRARVLVLSGAMRDLAVGEALARGAWGYILKLDAPEAVHEGLAVVMAGRRYLSPTVAQEHPGLV